MLLLCTNKATYTDKFPKKIWILWLQGWDEAPWLQQNVKESWKLHNPEWEVICIDEKNCPVSIEGDTYQDKADVIRLRILDEIGGVWADSTMLCTEPLDNWYKNAVNPSRFWMYHGWENCKYGAIWFILSYPGSYIIKTWREEIDNYWKDNNIDYGYHATDILFKKLVDENKQFSEEWSKVPKKCCEDYGSAHMFAGKVLSTDLDLQESLVKNPPHAVKLDKGCSSDPSLDNNCTFAVKKSLGILK